MISKIFTVEQINEMKVLRASWKSLKEIAEKYGSNINTVWNHCKEVDRPVIGRKQSIKNYYQRHKERLKKQALDRYYKNKW